jgi:hypothetical protein
VILRRQPGANIIAHHRGIRVQFQYVVSFRGGVPVRCLNTHGSNIRSPFSNRCYDAHLDGQASGRGSQVRS